MPNKLANRATRFHIFGRYISGAQYESVNSRHTRYTRHLHTVAVAFGQWVTSTQHLVWGIVSGSRPPNPWSGGSSFWVTSTQPLVWGIQFLGHVHPTPGLGDPVSGSSPPNPWSGWSSFWVTSPNLWSGGSFLGHVHPTPGLGIQFLPCNS